MNALLDTNAANEALEATEGASDSMRPALVAAASARSAIDWERTRLTPGLVKAMLAAQRKATTIGKTSHNEGGGGAPKYDYASADTMIAAARPLFNDEGLVWACASRLLEPPAMQVSDKQWVCSLVRTESLLMHVDDKDEIGMFATSGECISVASTARPPDKADKSAETFLRGYMARDLLALDRGKVPDDEDVDRRVDDSNGRGGRFGRQTQAPARASAEQRRTEHREKHAAPKQEQRAEPGPRTYTAEQHKALRETCAALSKIAAGLLDVKTDELVAKAGLPSGKLSGEQLDRFRIWLVQEIEIRGGVVPAWAEYHPEEE